MESLLGIPNVEVISKAKFISNKLISFHKILSMKRIAIKVTPTIIKLTFTNINNHLLLRGYYRLETL